MTETGSLLDRCSYVREIFDPRLGAVKLLKDPVSEGYVMHKKKAIKDKERLVPLLKGLEKRKSSPCIYYVPLMDYRHSKDSTLCADFHRIEIFVPYPEEDLTKDIAERVAQQRPFSNHELTTLLYDLVGAGLHLQKMGIAHTSLSPDWVALTTTGYAVVEDPLLDKNRILDVGGSGALHVAPEAYRAAKQSRGHGSDFCKTKADVFAVGLIILEAGLLRTVPEIYRDRRGETIDVGALAEDIAQFEARYPNNNLVKTTVRRMLSVEAKDRPDFKELKIRLPDYKVVKDYFRRNHDQVPTVAGPAPKPTFTSPQVSRRSIEPVSLPRRGSPFQYRQPAQNQSQQFNQEAIVEEEEEECPLEDPRNPHHQEYLKLKQHAMGTINKKTGVFTPIHERQVSALTSPKKKNLALRATPEQRRSQMMNQLPLDRYTEPGQSLRVVSRAGYESPRQVVGQKVYHRYFER